MKSNPEIARTIIAQLGNLTLSMLGAKNLINLGNGLRFDIKGSRKVNKIAITLSPDDTYTVTFYKFNRRTLDCPTVAEYDDVYVSMLCDLIQSQTGLATRL